MTVWAVLEAIGTIVAVINGLYQFGKNVEEFSGNPTDVNRQRYLSTYAAVLQSRNQILAAQTSILAAISDLDARIFRQVMADTLGDSDTAVQNLNEWHRSGSDASRALALDRSAGAVADMLRYVDVYPRPSIVFAHVEILTCRLAVLCEVDKQFAQSATTRAPLQAGIGLIRDAANEIESAVRRANTVRVFERRTSRPDPDDPGSTIYFVSAEVSYRNLIHTVSYTRSIGPYELGDDAYAQELRAARADAEAARHWGTVADIAHARVPELRQTAATLESIVRRSELQTLSSELDYSPTVVEDALYVQRRQELGVAEAARALVSGSTALADARPQLAVAIGQLAEDESASDAESLAAVIQEIRRGLTPAGGAREG
ncbi:hypothetical protein NOCA240049 [metagenome]|uniref:Uncharacterized protein n=1 Tax=metagenome TaxID=256318 RepID=A0A2P2C5R2_9ZZZZ